MKKRFYQGQAVHAVHEVFKDGQSTLLVLPTGCHRIGTKVMLFTGDCCPVEDICVNDALMGPDGTARIVTALARGHGDMVEIVPVKGAPFVVNIDHILTLKRTSSGEIIDVSVRDYLHWARSRKHLYKLFRVGIAKFPITSRLLVPAYLAGLILGDGRSLGTGVQVTKQIPPAYLTASWRDRLDILAGLIDTDGSPSCGGYDFVSKSRRLADGVTFLARSVGLAAYVSCSIKRCQGGFAGVYWRVSISGDCSIVPVRIRRKKLPRRRQKKSVLVTGFAVTTLLQEDYYGFSLTGDGRYLMADFTVTHNTGKTVVFAHIIKERAEFGRAMVVAHRDELLSQACDKIRRVCEVSPDVEKANQWADQAWQQWRSPVVVSSVQTLNSGRNGAGRMTRFDPKDFGLLVIDEAHHATGNSYRKVISHFQQNPNCKILGVTATPNRHDEEALGQVFGSCAFEYWIADAIRDGWLVPIHQQIKYLDDLDLSSVSTTAGDLNGAELAKVLEYEKLLLAMADETYRCVGQRKALVFAASVAQAQRLAEILNRHQDDCARFVSGKTPVDERREIIHAYARRDFRFLVNCAVTTEGFDDPGIEVVVMGRPTKSQPLYTQMLGRGTRPLPGTVDGIDDYEPQRHLGLEAGCEEQAAIRRQRIAESPKPHMEVIDFVGNAGRHKLISACNVLGGKYAEDVIAAAAADGRKSGLPSDVAARLKAAQERLEREAAEAHRRKHIVGKASYRSHAVDPFDVFGIEPEREAGWNKSRMPTPAMVAFMERAGIPSDGVSFARAGQLIGEQKRRWAEGQCTFKQAKILRKHGFDPDSTMADAKVIIDGIAANGWRGWPADRPRPRSQAPSGSIQDDHDRRAVEEMYGRF